jgi:hypothetical protein
LTLQRDDIWTSLKVLTLEYQTASIRQGLRVGESSIIWSPTFTCEVDSNSYDHNLVFSSIFCNKQSRDVGCVTRMKLDYKSFLENFSPSLANYTTINDPDLIAESLTRDLQLATTRSTKNSNFVVNHADRIRDRNSSRTLELMTEKNKLLKKRKKKPTNNKVKLRLHTVSMKLKNSLKSDFSRDIHNKLSTKDPKKLWMGINEVIGRSKSEKTTLIEDPVSGMQVTDPAEIASTFNEFFASCGLRSSSTNTTNQFTEITPQESMVLFLPSENEVSNQISCLRNNCAPGLDGINSRTLKALSSAITPILTNLITVIFETGTFPSCLKTAVTIPIFKSGELPSSVNLVISKQDNRRNHVSASKQLLQQAHKTSLLSPIRLQRRIKH